MARSLPDEIMRRIGGGQKFGRGVITAVDVVSVPKRYTVNGRPMVANEVPAPVLAVGDVVTFVDQLSPFILGRIEQ